MTTTTLTQPATTPEIEKARAVAREVHEAGQAALMLLARAEAALADGDRDRCTRATDDARRRLLGVYAKIATLRHDGPQPKAVPA